MIRSALPGYDLGVTDNPGVDPSRLGDEHLRRELWHLYETRPQTLLGGSESALRTHTERMFALERKLLRRFPAEATPDLEWTRTGRRRAAGQRP